MWVGGGECGNKTSNWEGEGVEEPEGEMDGMIVAKESEKKANGTGGSASEIKKEKTAEEKEADRKEAENGKAARNNRAEMHHEIM